MVELEGVIQKKIDYKGFKIQTYSFGTGKHVVLALPAFPHSGLVYAHLFRQYRDCDIKFITLDIPGWIGNSDNLFEVKEFTFEECVRICLKILDIYNVERYSIIGFSFGTAIETTLAYYDTERIKRLVFVSPMIDCNIGKKDGNRYFVDGLHRVHLHPLLKAYIKWRYYFLYRDNLLKYGMEESFLQLYDQFMDQSSSKILLYSLYRLFHTEQTLYLTKFKHKPIMVLNSRDENDMFKVNAKLIRVAATHQEDIYLEGRHEDFVLKPRLKVVKKVFEFLES